MDVLSQVLKSVRIEGALFFNAEFSAPWCFFSQESALMLPGIAPGAHSLIMFHFITEGRAYARLQDGSRQELEGGDVVIVAQGDAHFLGNGSPEKPVDAHTAFGADFAKGLHLVRYGGGGHPTRFVCGFLVCQSRLANVFLSGLPRLLKVRITGDPSGEWLAQSIRHCVAEDEGQGAGRNLVVVKLAEVLFVEALRRYVNDLPEEQKGWLAAARDPGVGKALGLLHQEPARQWTVAELARSVGMSRTILAERFRHFMGESPIAYLTRWRLGLGAEMLRTTESGVADVALAVGYSSEAAFNRAFRREFDSPPAQFRRESAAAMQA